MEKLRVMFLCTGSACRSQMAAAWTKRLAGSRIEVQSAAIEANDFNQYTSEVMAEVGIDLGHQRPASVDGELLEWADLLVTLCDRAEEQCPVVSFEKAKLHLPLPDPTKIKGDDDAIRAEFRETRDAVKKRVDFVLNQLRRVRPV